ncbi:PAQR family membrane homeostasis protein TrhA [Sphaerisporangium corydalis]|uniref:Hemolysin III family protein n=1 Tax=Sphaerisporangium corydalis TaxID=1441875 RepID=A0ABV9EC75_9ACTN|nr:hemolysin III family protein [Sphaerisporangium corydalis]
MTMTAAGPALAPTVTPPRLRGWLHAGALPAALIAGFTLVALGPTLQARLAAAIYAVTSGLLFGVSATYHRGRQTPRLAEVLRRLDHANIYLIIAGTYTPFALLALDGPVRVAVLSVIWTGAVAGVVFRALWMGAPRWLYTALYILLGWAAAFFLPQLLHGAGPAAVSLVIVGGVLYSLGGVVYGLRRPDPSPRWFGFHEVFHAFTLAAYVVQYVAVSLVVYSAA